MDIIEVCHCPNPNFEIYGFYWENSVLNICPIEVEMLGIKIMTGKCHVVWLNGKYSIVPFGTFFLSPIGHPSKLKSYPTEIDSPSDVYYSESIDDIIHISKIKIKTPDIHSLFIGLRSGPIYLYLARVENKRLIYDI